MFPLNEEYLAQTNETVFDAAQVAVDLAMAVVCHDRVTRQLALAAIQKYANWRDAHHVRLLLSECMTDEEKVVFHVD